MRYLCAYSVVLALVLPSGLAQASTVSFTNKTLSFSDGDFPTNLTADFNNDGREDFLSTQYVVQTGGGGEFSIRLSNGDGTYSAPKSYFLPGFHTEYPSSLDELAIGDFNNDGFADILISSDKPGVANGAPPLLYIYTNDGHGAFSLGATISVAAAATNLVSGDFNADHLPDVAYISNGQLHILFGNGKNGFTVGPVTGTTNQGEPLLLGDFDGDGNADLAYGDYANYTTATVLYGDSTGHFVPKFVTSPEPVLFSSGDVNSDGRTDLTGITRTISTHLDVFYGNTARTFVNTAKVSFNHCLAYSPALEDLDGNGLKDLVTVETDCSDTDGVDGKYYVGVRTRNANASYNAEQTLGQSVATPSSGAIVYGPYVIRLNQDSRPDVAYGVCADDECLGTTMKLALNTTTGSFPSCAPPNAFEGIHVCSPTAAAISPVPFRIGAATQTEGRKVEVWVDGVKKVEQLDGFSHYTFMDKSIPMTPGSHKIGIFAACVDNLVEQKTFTLTVK